MVETLNETLTYLSETPLFEVEQNNSFYWTSSDNIGVDEKSLSNAFCIDFSTGRVISTETTGYGKKVESHWVRPIFLY